MKNLKQHSIMAHKFPAQSMEAKKEMERYPGLSYSAAMGNVAQRKRIERPVLSDIQDTSPVPTTTPSDVSAETGINRPVLDFGAPQGRLAEIYGERFGGDASGEQSSLVGIQETQRKRAQALIDATEGLYQQQLTDIRQTGKEQLAGGSSLLTSAGLAGSPFKQSQEQKIQDVTQKELQAESSRRQAEITRLLGQADEKAETKFLAERKFFASERDAEIKYIKERQTESRDILGEFAKQGGGVSDLTDTQLSDMRERTGFDDFSLEVFMNANKPTAEAKDIKYETVGNKVVGYYFDKITQSIKTFESEPLADIAEIGKKYKAQITKDGTVLMIPEEFDPSVPVQDQIVQYGGKGEFVEEEEDKLLSTTEAERLGVPFGTTRQGAIDMGISPADVWTKGEKFKAEINISDKFLSQVKDPQKALVQLGLMKTAEKMLDDDFTEGKLNPVSQSILVTFQKLLDPGSVVRESEYARSGDGQDLLGRIKGFWTKLYEGGAGVTKENLRGFVTLSQEFAKNYEQSIFDAAMLAKTRVENNDLNLNNVLTGEIIDMLEESEGQRVVPAEEDKDPDKIFEDEFPEIEDTEQLFSQESQTSSKGYIEKIGQVTAEGSRYWKHGLDIDLAVGDPVPSPISGKIVFADTRGGFGNQVQVLGDDGNTYWLSHLDSFDVRKGDMVKAGQNIGKGGKTGKVIPLAGGDGSHLDLTIQKPDGTYISPKEIRKMLA